MNDTTLSDKTTMCRIMLGELTNVVETEEQHAMLEECEAQFIALQAENAMLREADEEDSACGQAAIDEIARLERECKQWQEAAGQQMTRAEGLEDANERLERELAAERAGREYDAATMREYEQAIRDAIEGLSTEVVSGNIDNIASALRDALKEVER